MNKLSQIFMYEGHQIRTVVINGQPHWVGKDVCDILEIGNASDALKRLDDDERTLVSIEGASNGLPVNVVTESGLYSLILGSKKPEAKPFKRWVTHEVLPTIRKTGSYNIEPEKPSYMLDDPIARASKWIEEMKHTQMLEQQTQSLQLKIEADRPKVVFAESLEVSSNSILIGQLAKLLKQNEIDIGQNRLFEILRRDGYLMSRGERYNQPTQRSMDMKIMEIKVGTRSSHSEGTKSTHTTKITGKGQFYFINKFKSLQQAN